MPIDLTVHSYTLLKKGKLTVLLGCFTCGLELRIFQFVLNFRGGVKQCSVVPNQRSAKPGTYLYLAIDPRTDGLVVKIGPNTKNIFKLLLLL